MKIKKSQLRRIIKEEEQRVRILEAQGHQMYTEDDDLRKLGDMISKMVAVATQTEALMNDMGYRYGELVALGTDARTVLQSIRALSAKYDTKLDDIVRFR